ncbi:LD-carboxypeptidase, partial [Staphylococcus hyicus]
MIKPKQLKQGDTIAIVSPSSGLAGEPHIRWRTEQGIRFIENMGYRVKVMPNTLNGLQWNYDHPEARAKSLMAAFQDDEVKAIVCT